MTDDYDLPADVSAPTCTAPTNCTGDGPVGSLPRGAIYTGTGTGPDRAYHVRTDADCDLTITMQPTGTEDLGLILYQAQCSNSLSDCVCVDDTGIGGDAESVLLNAVSGTDYFIVIDGYSSYATPPGPAGPFTLQITGTGCNLLGVPGVYHTITPCRLIDTRRTPDGPFNGPALAAGGSRTFQASAGACGIPTTATALFLNVTAVAPTVAGFLQIYPTGGSLPTVSAVNYSANQVRANNGVYALNGAGQFDIRAGQASGIVDVVVDVAGYFVE
jgi:hypothetical protein